MSTTVMVQGLYALLGFGLGVLVGLTHFTSLRWIVRLYTGGGALRAVVIQLGRFVVLVGVLAALAQLGAAALLGGAAGILAARAFVLRRSDEASWTRR